MYRAGVPILAGTDAMNPQCFPGFGLHDELALLVDAGLSPLAALQAATRNAAEEPLRLARLRILFYSTKTRSPTFKTRARFRRLCSAASFTRARRLMRCWRRRRR